MRHRPILAALELVAAIGLLAACLPVPQALARPALAGTSAAAPSNATPEEVLAALGIHPHAEFVFLVDTSDSMQSAGLYQRVRAELSGYLRELAQQQPQDQVVVISFGTTSEVVYGPGPPTADIGLPAVADGGTSDFGPAFAFALDQLADLPSGIKAGGVVLLSDGSMSAPDDPLYDGGKGYGAPGWAQLRTRARALPIPVTGFVAPLSANRVYVDDEAAAVTAVLSSAVTLPTAATNLPAALSFVTKDVIDNEVGAAVAAEVQLDSEGSVLVTWAGLPSAGTQPLRLGVAGHLDVELIVTALTQRVPLYLTDLRVTAPGLPLIVTGDLPADVPLAPGHSVTIPIRVAWDGGTSGRSVFGESRTHAGRLALTAQVRSPWTLALTTYFDNVTFAVGGLRDSTSAVLTVSRPTERELPYLVLGVLVVLLLIGVACFRARLSGSLTLTHRDESSGTFELWPWPLARQRTADLIGRPGVVTVHGSVFRRTMRVKLRLDNGARGAHGPVEVVRLPPGRLRNINGVDVQHTPRGQRRETPQRERR
jgi:von Willebrand factor type A domain